jgi:hypothetical protein
VRQRRPNPRLAKTHRSYTVEEIATLFDVHRNTVREWITKGLPTIDSRRPALILGSTLSEFLRLCRNRNKRSCKPGEIYCVRCREPRTPADRWAQYKPLTATQGNLIGICPSCDSWLYRRVSLANLAQVIGPLSVTVPEAPQHIDESKQPSVNSDLTQGAPTHGNAQLDESKQPSVNSDLTQGAPTHGNAQL